MNILETLRAKHAELSNAERRIADIVLSDPEAVIHSSTAVLARKADVSDPTVARFCRSLACKGFPDFKVQLAQSLARGAPYLSQAVSPGDSVDHYINKLVDASQTGLETIRSQLNRQQTEHVIEKLAQANHIEFYGMGAGAAIAHDAQHKFFRLGKTVIAYEDYLKQRMAAAVAGPDTVIVFLSFTGRTTSLLDVHSLAKEKKAVTTIAITAPESPLAHEVDFALTIDTSWEDTTLYTPMTSRLVFLTIIDILATGVALKMGTSVETHLRNVKESLSDTKLEKRNYTRE